MRLATVYERQWLWIRLPVMALALIAVGVVWRVFFPIPSTHLRLATGNVEGIYYAYGLKYAQKLALRGIDVEVLASTGSAENLNLLTRSTGGVDAALVKGGYESVVGVATATGTSNIQALANVDLEPVWIFSRLRAIDSVSQLKGLRLSAGTKYSGSYAVTMNLLKAAGLSARDVDISNTTGLAAARALAQSELDVIITVSSPDASLVTTLVAMPNVHLVYLKRTAALTEQITSLESRLLPRDMLNPATHYPPQDMAILTTNTNLVVRGDMHPALKRLVVAAAVEIHGDGGLLFKPGEFPNLRQMDFPAAPEARDTMAQGLPWLEQHLSFWWAQVVWRLAYLVLPLFLVALWVSNMMSNYVQWQIKSRINRWYGELKYIEHDLNLPTATDLDLKRYFDKLRVIGAELDTFATPRELMHRFVILHHHIDFVRKQVSLRRGR